MERKEREREDMEYPAAEEELGATTEFVHCPLHRVVHNTVFHSCNGQLAFGTV
jgi:hypothetical protein